MPPKATQQEKKEEQNELLDKIEPDKQHKQWTIGTGEHAMTFTQKPLSYFAKMEFYALLADAIDKAMDSDSGMTVTSVLENVGIGSDQVFNNADSLLRPMMKLVRFVPDLLEEAYCIFLAVPRGDRFLVKDMMGRPVDDGGLSDEDGMMILQTFVDQNINAIEEFFTGQLPKLVKRVRGLSRLMSPGTK